MEEKYVMFTAVRCLYQFDINNFTFQRNIFTFILLWYLVEKIFEKLICMRTRGKKLQLWRLMRARSPANLGSNARFGIVPLAEIVKFLLTTLLLLYWFIGLMVALRGRKHGRNKSSFKDQTTLVKPRSCDKLLERSTDSAVRPNDF